METTQGNSLCSYLYFKLAKTLYFSFSLLSFFFYKSREMEGRTGGEGKDWHLWEGRRWQRINTVQIMCTHVCKCKNGICLN
jgi:hypothetical protein